MATIVVQRWVESERGWGTRPDGYSAHLSMHDCRRFVEDYWRGQPDGPVPDSYERPDGTPFLCDVPEDVVPWIETTQCGQRLYTRPPWL
jgi:hypothetical protein